MHQLGEPGLTILDTLLTSRWPQPKATLCQLPPPSNVPSALLANYYIQALPLLLCLGLLILDTASQAAISLPSHQNQLVPPLPHYCSVIYSHPGTASGPLPVLYPYCCCYISTVFFHICHLLREINLIYIQVAQLALFVVNM